jgi:hypothetical protein
MNNVTQKVVRTVVSKVYQDEEGDWCCKISEKLTPDKYECGAPRLSNKHLIFYSNTADGAKQKALDFIRGAAEALRGGSA